MHYNNGQSANPRIEKDDLEAYLRDNRLWIETFSRLNLFGEAVRGFEPGAKAPKTYCPLHGGRTGEAFGFIKKRDSSSDFTGIGVCNTCGKIHGFKLVMAATGWSFPETLRELAIASGYMEGIAKGYFDIPEKSPAQLAREAEMKKRQEAQDHKNLEKNKQLWAEAIPLNKSAAEPALLYFKNRGLANRISALGDEVRLHPQIRYFDVTHTACVITQDGEKHQKFWINKYGERVEAPRGRMMESFADIMKQTVTLDYQIAEPARRFLEMAPPSLVEHIRKYNPRFHKGIGYIEDLGLHPCLLTRIRNPNGLPVNLHQTFITVDGQKAAVPSVKKMRPAISSLPITGGGAQLCPPSPVIGVGEGLETLLSVNSAIRMPVWPLLNATLMASWVPPMGTKHVYIWEDPDPAGEGNAQKLAERVINMGIDVTRCSTKELRPEGDYDWNDVLRHMGPDVFPHQDWFDQM